jgi:hypothetical protein
MHPWLTERPHHAHFDMTAQRQIRLTAAHAATSGIDASVLHVTWHCPYRGSRPDVARESYVLNYCRDLFFVVLVAITLMEAGGWPYIRRSSGNSPGSLDKRPAGSHAHGT